MSIVAATCLSLFLFVSSQSIFPTNSSSGLWNSPLSPRYLLMTIEVAAKPNFKLASLGPYANISYGAFLETHILGQLVNVDPLNSGDVLKRGQITNVLCDTIPSQGIIPYDQVIGAII